MAIPSGGGGTKTAPAAPFTYPVLTKGTLASIAKEAQPATATNPLNAQAAALAQGSIADQIAAIQQQQAADVAAANATAKQIGQASTAAAQFLGPGGYNLGGLTATDYANAIKQTGGLASGYSGQLRTDVQNAADQAQNTLAGIRGNEQTVYSHGGDLANALYGLRGSLPGQALAAEGLAATTTARLLPSQLLASGLNSALGVRAAGLTDARALNPQIATARGKLGSLTTQYLNTLYGQQQKQESLDLAAAKAKADAIYRGAYLQHLQAGDKERVAHDKATEAAGVSYHNALITLAQGRLSVAQVNAATGQYNAQTSRINANKPSSSGGFTIGNTRYNADGSILVKGAGSGGAKRVPGSLTQNEVSGLVDTWSQPTTESQTKPVIGADGQPVIGTNGVPVTQSQTVTTRQPYTFTQAINQLRGLKVPRADAIQAVLANPVFAQQAVTALQGSSAAYARKGVSLTKALAQIRSASGLPDSLIRPALQQAYSAQGAAAARGLAQPGDVVTPNIFGR